MALLGCAPSITATPTPTLSDPGQAGLYFLATSTGDTATLSFSAGQFDAFDLTVKVSGNDLRVNAPRYCRTDRQEILCTVPDVPAGKNFILPMKGSNLSAVATYKRASGTAYSSEARK
ncbi:hypothetical protein [uncultured Deinococcus sp.]|uniref:hypothetical protein n=1 Tax=uncultured Deinococcus sp. TaxID=158789 RepID=UPI0025878646|nr:hypothetical protein [uncultured Deinococcus sp.]